MKHNICISVNRNPCTMKSKCLNKKSLAGQFVNILTRIKADDILSSNGFMKDFYTNAIQPLICCYI